MTQQEIIAQRDLLQSRLDEAGFFPPLLIQSVERRIEDLNKLITV